MRPPPLHPINVSADLAQTVWSRPSRLLVIFGIGVFSCVGIAAESPTQRAHDPSALTLLETHCVKCHGGEKTKAGLDLTTQETLLRGGESGPAISPGEPVETSLLYRMIAHLEEPGMPHKEDKLPDDAIRQIATGSDHGAPYARPLNKGAPAIASTSKAKTEFAITPADRAHWAFQSVKRPPLPAVKNRAW